MTGTANPGGRQEPAIAAAENWREYIRAATRKIDVDHLFPPSTPEKIQAFHDTWYEY